MKKDLLIDTPGVRLYRSQWWGGSSGLPPAWHSTERPRISLPQSPLYYGGSRGSDLVMPGSAVVLSGDREHAVTRTAPDAGHSFWICIDPAVFDDLSDQRARRAAQPLTDGRMTTPSDLRVDLAVKALARVAIDNHADPIETEELLYSIVERLCNQSAAPVLANKELRAHRDAIEHAIALLSSGDPSLTLDRIGRAVHLSPHHFCRIFRRCTGMTVQGFRSRSRLMYAADRVLGGQGTLASIALDCGYSDQPHMTRAFTSALGITPARLSRDLPSLRKIRTILQDASGGLR